MTSLAMLSACETVEPQDNQILEPEIESSEHENAGDLLFTANIGADTKTYLEWDEMAQVYKTRWIEGDTFCLIDASAEELVYEKCSLVDGAGTSTGTFAGSLESDSYVALYANPGNWNATSKELQVEMSSYQYHFTYCEQSDKKPFRYNAYPMVAKSNTKEFDFYNLSSILKFSIAGNGQELETIRIRSNGDEVLSGYGLVNFENEVPTMSMMDGGYNWVDYYVHERLYEPVECYVVLPSQTYENGFTIEIYTDAGWMDVTTGANITLEQSRLHEIKTPIQFEDEYGVWVLHNNYGDIRLSNGGDYQYATDVYLSGSLDFSQTKTGEYLGLSTQYEMSYYPTNTWVNLDSEYSYAYMASEGYYDVYLYPEYKMAYIINSDLDLNIPSWEHIYQSKFSSLWDVEDEQYIMVSGTVLARCNRGFILAMGHKNYNNVLVYNPNSDVENPYPGEVVDVYVKKITYRNLPELSVDADTWMYRHSSSSVYISYDEVLDLTSAEDFVAYEGGSYEYIRCTGNIVKSGSLYYLEAKGADGKKAEIFFPTVDMTTWVGKEVMIDGYFLGFKSDGNLTIMMTNIAEFRDGSTEDYTVGEDIQMQ